MKHYRAQLAYELLAMKEGGRQDGSPPSRSAWLVIMCLNLLFLSSASKLRDPPGPLSSPVFPTRR